MDVQGFLELSNGFNSPSCVTQCSFKAGSALSQTGLFSALYLVGSPSGTVLESCQALGNLLSSQIVLPARGEGPQGASQGSLNSPDKGFRSWLVYAVQNTPGLNAPPAPPGI